MGGAAATVDEASAMAGGGARARPAAGTAGSLSTPAATGSQGDAAWLALCAIARWHQVAADPASLAHQLGLAPSEPVRVPDLLRAAALLGLKARLVRTRADR
ncbi:MAG: hypothetical protein KDH48_16200, partial [Rhodoferax sp.]|nr:hypothetical protein [Rhodoferax sp.]